jgi:hypothetical protein
MLHFLTLDLLLLEFDLPCYTVKGMSEADPLAKKKGSLLVDVKEIGL